MGVDGGGSKTRTVAVEEGGAVLLDHLADGTDLPARGAEHVRRVLREIRDLVRDAAHDAAIAGIALGLPAWGEIDAWDAELARLVDAVFPPWPLRIHNDVRLALEGALPGESGVLVLSGTGSMAWGKARGADGWREARTGGWGPLLGDEGSGWDLGVEALRAVCRADDGRGPSTALSAGVLEALGVPDVRGALALLSLPAQPPRARVASLARVVADAADGGDRVANGLIDAAAAHLRAHVEALLVRLELPATTAVATAGGCFGGRALREAFALELRRAGLAAPRRPYAAPAFGGAVLAGLDPRALDAAVAGGGDADGDAASP